MKCLLAALVIILVSAIGALVDLGLAVIIHLAFPAVGVGQAFAVIFVASFLLSSVVASARK